MSNTMWPRLRSTSVLSGVFIHPAVLATIDKDRKLGVLPLLGDRAATPANTTSPGPRFTYVPSGILIHPAVWPQ